MLRLIIAIIVNKVSPDAFNVVNNVTKYLPDLFPLSSLSLLLYELLSITRNDLKTVTWEKILDADYTDTKKKLIALAIQTVVFWVILFVIDYFVSVIHAIV